MREMEELLRASSTRRKFFINIGTNTAYLASVVAGVASFYQSRETQKLNENLAFHLRDMSNQKDPDIIRSYFGLQNQRTLSLMGAGAEFVAAFAAFLVAKAIEQE